MDVSVVIPAYNAEHTIGDQLEALAKQDFDGDWEIVVVDNACTDGTAAVVESWRARCPNLRVVAERNRGVDRARNTGVRSAVAARVLLCDADDVAGEGWVRALSAALDEHDVVAGRLEYDELNQGALSADTLARPLSEGLATSWRRQWGMTSNLGFRRAVFDAVGGFDPEFERGGSDDVDFCLRTGSAGFTLGFVPDAVVHYRRRRSAREQRRQMYQYALGYEQLYTKLRARGELQAFPRSTRLHLSASRARELVRDLPTLGSRSGRLQYSVRVAKTAGGLAGIWKYQVRGAAPMGETVRSVAARGKAWVMPHGVVARQRTRARARTEAERRERYAAALAAATEQRAPIHDYDTLLGLATEAGVDADLLRTGSIPPDTLDFILERIDGGPGLHLGNYAGLSLAYLAARTEGVIVAVDPNIEHWGLPNPQDTVVRLLDAAGVSERVLLIVGYSLEKTPGNDGSIIAGHDPAASYAQELAPVDVLGNLRALGVKFRWAVLDGNHEPDYLRAELDALHPLMTDDGVLFLDDVDPHWPEIRKVFESAGEGWRPDGKDHRTGVLRRAPGSEK